MEFQDEFDKLPKKKIHEQLESHSFAPKALKSRDIIVYICLDLQDV
jgi:hypothetical protein